MAQNREKVGYGYLGQSSYWEQGSNKPRYYGKVTISGQDLEIAGWDKEKNGRSYVSVQFTKIAAATKDEKMPF